MRLRILSAIIVMWSIAPDAFAQAVTMWGEAGKQQTELGNGNLDDSMAFAGGISLVIGGSTGKDKSFLVPLNFELRSDQNFGFVDMLATGDLAFRVGPVAFGPGANFGYIWRENANDPRCPQFPVDGSSCLQGLDFQAVGTRDIGNFLGIGFSGFGKVNFGPQGRAFVQARYIKYLPDWMYFRSAAEALASQGFEFDIPTDFPEFESGRDIRLAGGYTFGSGTGAMKFIRLSYSDRAFLFTPSGANDIGIFDQKTKQFGVGFGFTF